MKAYIVGLRDVSEVGNEIVFANSVKEAKKKAISCEVVETRDSYIDIEVKRYRDFDDMENLSSRELAKEKWRMGWLFFEETGLPNCDTATDEEFYNWYDAI